MVLNAIFNNISDISWRAILFVEEMEDPEKTINLSQVTDNQGRQENFWAPGQKETWPPSSNSPNNDIQTKSTTVCHKQGISTTKMN